MKTRSGWFHLRGLFLLCGVGVCWILLNASANAGPTVIRKETLARPHAAMDMPAEKPVRLYIMTSASAIPKPINYVIGGIVTTAVPVQIIGRGEIRTR